MNRFIFLLVSIISFPLMVSAQTEPLSIDGIAAVVESDIVLKSEVEARFQNFMIQMEGQQITNEQLADMRSQVLDQLIIESIQIQLANRSGIRMDDNMLNQHMSNIAIQNGMTFEALRAALDEDGIYNQFREQQRREWIIGSFQQRAVEQRTIISRQEIENYLRSEAGASSVQPEYLVAHIMITADNVPREEDRLELANLLRQRILDGENIVEIANSGTVLGRPISGGEIGWNKVEGHPSIFSEVIPELSAGDISEPFSSPSGHHLVQVLETRGGADLVVPQTHVRHIMIAPNEIRTEAQAEELIHELYDRIKEGEDFAQIARQNTDDYGSIVSGGDLDWVSPGQLSQLSADFMTYIDATAIDEISEPFRGDQGWHIVEVIDRREQDMTEENTTYQAELILRDRKYEMELENWLTELKDTSYINIVDDSDGEG